MGGRYSVVPQPDETVLDEDDVVAYSLRNIYVAHAEAFNGKTLNAHEKYVCLKELSKGMFRGVRSHREYTGEIWMTTAGSFTNIK